MYYIQYELNLIFVLNYNFLLIYIFHLCRISSAVWPPSQSMVKDGCTNPSCFAGYYADLFHAIQSVTNFTYIIKNEDIAGAKQDDGSWSGQIGV